MSEVRVKSYTGEGEAPSELPQVDPIPVDDARNEPAEGDNS